VWRHGAQRNTRGDKRLRQRSQHGSAALTNSADDTPASSRPATPIHSTKRSSVAASSAQPSPDCWAMRCRTVHGTGRVSDVASVPRVTAHTARRQPTLKAVLRRRASLGGTVGGTQRVSRVNAGRGRTQPRTKQSTAATVPRDRGRHSATPTGDPHTNTLHNNMIVRITLLNGGKRAWTTRCAALSTPRQ
jgi:hypothetical protein